MHALHQGSMAPNSKLELDEQEAAALDKRFHLQLLLYKKGKPYPALDPVSIVFTIKARKFYRDNSFRANDFFYQPAVDRKSTRLNSSHVRISYAVFCLKKKT